MDETNRLTNLQKIVGAAGIVLLLMAIFLPRFFTEPWIDFLGSAFGGGASVALIIILATGQVATILAGRIYTVWHTPRRMVKMEPPLVLYSVFVFMGASSTAGESQGQLERYVARAGAPDSLVAILPNALYFLLAGLLLAVALDIFLAARRHGFWLTLAAIVAFWAASTTLIFA